MSRSNRVVRRLVPAMAAAAMATLAIAAPVGAVDNAGTGTVAAGFTYSGVGIPPLLQGDCSIGPDVSFGVSSLSWQQLPSPVPIPWSSLPQLPAWVTPSAAVFVNDNGSFYIGGVTISGTGTGCDTTGLGSGNLALSVTGTNVFFDATLSCTGLTGTYLRVGALMTTVINPPAGSGSACNVNQWPGGQPTFLSVGALYPTKGDVNTGIQGADYFGSFITAG